MPGEDELRSGADGQTPAENPERYDVDAFELLSTVRTRRHVRAAVRFLLLAIPGWLAVSLAVHEWVPEPSRLWYQIDKDTAWVLLIIVLAFGFTLIGLLGWRPDGSGPAAAALVPLAGAGVEPRVISGQDTAGGLLPELRRKSLVGFGTAMFGLAMLGRRSSVQWRCRGRGRPRTAADTSSRSGATPASTG
jgi:hypothetical protein